MRILQGLLGLLVLLALGSAGSLGWLFKTQSGLEFALEQTSRWVPILLAESKPTLQFDAAEGTLWDGFSLGRVHWASKAKGGDDAAPVAQKNGLEATVEQVNVQLDWPALWHRAVVLTRLTAGSIDLQTARTSSGDKETTPMRMPESIQLPVSVDIQTLSIDRVQWNEQIIEEVHTELVIEQGLLQLRRLGLSHEAGVLTASGRVALVQPFETQLDFALKRRDVDEITYTADVGLQGNFEVFALQAKAQAEHPERQSLTQALNAQALVTLLKPVKVQSIELDMARFDPSKWLSGAPVAQLTTRLNLKPNAEFTQSSGSLEVRNERPLALQNGGVPLRQLNAQFDVAQSADGPVQVDLKIKELMLADEGVSAGRVQGSLSWLGPLTQGHSDDLTIERLGDWVIDLDVQNIRSTAFTAELPPTRLSGAIKLRKTLAQFEIEHLQVSDGAGRIRGQGRVSASGQWDSQARLDFTQIRPESYLQARLPALTGILNGQLNWQGLLNSSANRARDAANAWTAWQPEGQVDLVLKRSTVAQAPVTFNAQATGRLDRVRDLLVQAEVMGNTFSARGAYGGQSDVIQWQANAEHLDRLGELIGIELGGGLAMQGQITGKASTLSTDFTVKAKDLKLSNAWRVARLEGALQLGLAQDSIWQGDIQVASLGQLQGEEDLARSLTLSLSGTRKNHALEVEFESDLRPFSRRRALSGRALVNGGWQPKGSRAGSGLWLGKVSTLQVGGLWRPLRSLSLKQAFEVQLGASSVQLGTFVLQGEDRTHISSEQVQISEQRVRLKGHAKYLSMPRLGSVFKRQVTLETDELVTRWNWSLSADPADLVGHVDVGYVSGGFRILEDAEIKVPVNDFETQVDFTRKHVLARANLDVAKVGVVSGEVQLPVRKDPATGRWGIQGDQPIQGDLAAGLSDLSWLGPLLSPALRSEGEGYVALALSGSAEQPELAGRVIGRDLQLTELNQGMRFEEGEVIVDFDNDQARIETFKFNVYHRQAPARRLEELGPLIQGVGKVAASGQWNLSGLEGRFDLNLDRVALIQRPDRWLMVSANLNLSQPQLAGQALQVRGEVLAHGAYIEMPKTGPQTLGDDVVIRGQVASTPVSSPLDVVIQARLGDLFFVNVEGLRSRLKGGMELLVQDGGSSGLGRGGRRLEARGTIQAVDGTYRAYGQDLTIERGVVNFQGPLSNPGLNVRAVRKGSSVEAGVEITGSVNRPQVALVSDPPVPDSEKLSWMIIGRGSNSSDRDTTLLLTAAAALFGNDSDDSTTLKIAKSLGVDDFALSSGSLTAADSRAVGSQVAISPGADASAAVLGDEDPLLTQRLITLGKRLNRRLYLSFEQSVTTSANVVKLTYQYSRRLSFIARGGADNAVDMLYQFSFD